MSRKALTMFILMLLWPTVSLADLTGKWSCNDGGFYYLRQIDNKIYWYGERAEHDPPWSNVFTGRLQGDKIKGRWADIPKGRAKSHGEIHLQISEGGNVLQATRKTGGFGGSKWIRVGYHPRLTVREDCVNFNPRNTKVEFIKGRWKIVDGSHWLFDFGNKKAEARAALRIIKHYRINQSCFVGRPDPSIKYLLVSGRAPAGSLQGEDCLTFNSRSAVVKRIGGRWKIVDGSHWLFDFGNKEDEARKTLSIIKKYKFKYSCFVGRPDPSFVYLRK